MSLSNSAPTVLIIDDNEIALLTAVRLRPNLENEWDTDCIVGILDILILHDLPLKIILKHELGRIVRKIQKKASGYLNQIIVNKSKKVVCKWKALLRKESEAVKKTLPRTEPSKQPLQLAIQDKPSTKPFIPSTSVFPGGKHRLPNPRSTSYRYPGPYHQNTTSVEDLLDKIENKPPTPNYRSTEKSISGSTTPEKETINSHQKPQNKHVRFKPNDQLPTTLEYHMDTPTRNSDQTIRLSTSLDNSKKVQHAWYRPRLIQIPHSCRRPIITQSHGSTSNQYRLENCLSPSSPTELNEELPTKKYPKIIPLFEIDISDEDEPCVQTPDSVNTLPFLDGYLPSSHRQSVLPSTHLLQTHHITAYHQS